MALPAREFTQLHYICCGIRKRCWWLSQKYIALKRKNINWIIGRSFLTEQPMPGQSFSSEGHAGHCPSIPLRQIMLFFMPRCIVRTWHKRLEASFYHFWHKYKPGAVLLDYYNSKLQSISYQETDLVSCGMRMGATVPQVSRSCNSIWPIPQHCSQCFSCETILPRPVEIMKLEAFFILMRWKLS